MSESKPAPCAAGAAYGRPICKEIVPPGRQPLLPAVDLAQVCRWVALNRDVILDFWDGTIVFDEVTARLQKLP